MIESIHYVQKYAALMQLRLHDIKLNEQRKHKVDHIDAKEEDCVDFRRSKSIDEKEDQRSAN